jgi:hypothetical protein
MNTSLQARPRGFGVAGSLIGLLALIAVAIPQWVLPVVLPAAPAQHDAVDAGHSLKERIMAKLKGTALKKDSAPKMEEAESGQEEWRRVFQAAAVSLGLLAIVLAVFSLIRREERLYAGVAAALGIGAIALQAAILVAGAAVTILILYLVLKQSDGGFQFAGIGIGAIFVFAVIAILGAGLVSPQLAALLAGAVILILIVLSFLGGA